MRTGMGSVFRAMCRWEVGGTAPYAFMVCTSKAYKTIQKMPIARNILDVKAISHFVFKSRSKLHSA